MKKNLRVLIIEDRPTDAELLEQLLKKSGFQVVAKRVDTPNDLRYALIDFDPTVILADFTMPAMTGLTALEIARTEAPHLPFIFVSGTIGEETAVEALKMGADDYVLKENPARLAPAIERALRERAARTALLITQDALRSSEELFRAFMRYLPGRAATQDRNDRYIFVNEKWEQIEGMDGKNIIGLQTSEVLPADIAPSIQAIHRRVLDTNTPMQQVFSTNFTGRQQWWLANHFPILDSQGRPSLVGTIELDITEQKEQEKKLERLMRIHAASSRVNSFILRAKNHDELFHEVCRTAVNQGGFDMAWLGTRNETQTVIPLSWAGPEADQLLLTSTSARTGNGAGTGVAEQALREKKTIVVNDLSMAPDGKSEHQQQSAHPGYRSVIGLPLVIDGAAHSVLMLYSKQINFFNNDEELELLSALVSDIAFGITHINLRAPSRTL